MLVAAAGFLCATAVSATAQAVSGHVREVGTGRAVPGATVTLLDSLDAELGTATSDSDGNFALHAPAPGRYRLHVRRGDVYSIRTAAFALTTGQTRRFQLDVPLPPVPLPAVEAEAERRESPAMAAFHARRQQGLGTFFTREQLETYADGTRMNDLLRGLAGIRVPESGPYVEMRLGCPARIVVNGVTWFRPPFRDADRETLREFFALRTGDIEGIEIYRGGSELPPIFAGVDAQCGVVAVWLASGSV